MSTVTVDPTISELAVRAGVRSADVLAAARACGIPVRTNRIEERDAELVLAFLATH